MFSTSKQVPVRAKPIYYNTNGTGRDTYIHVNNGGFTINNPNFSTLDTQGSTHDIDKVRRQSPKKNGYNSVCYSPQSNNKMNHYHPDGTGRDGYIKVDNGGQSIPSNATNQNSNFLGNLRQYPKIQIRNSYNISRKLQSSFQGSSATWKSQSQLLKEQQQFQQQQQKNDNLAQPKWVKLPNELVNSVNNKDQDRNLFISKSRGKAYRLRLPLTILEDKKTSAFLPKTDRVNYSNIDQSSPLKNQQMVQQYQQQQLQNGQDQQQQQQQGKGLYPPLQKSQSTGKLSDLVQQQLRLKKSIQRKSSQNNVVYTLGQFTDRSNIRKQQYQHSTRYNTIDK